MIFVRLADDPFINGDDQNARIKDIVAEGLRCSGFKPTAADVRVEYVIRALGSDGPNDFWAEVAVSEAHPELTLSMPDRTRQLAHRLGAILPSGATLHFRLSAMPMAYAAVECGDSALVAG